MGVYQVPQGWWDSGEAPRGMQRVSGGSRVDDADVVLQEAHAIHLEGRGASHARQPLPSVHEKNITTPASAAVTTWCYSLLVLSSLLFYF